MKTHELNKDTFDELRIMITRFGLMYKFALDEISTKVKILKDEFRLIHDYNPIEQINTRVKSAKSLIKKVKRKNLPFELETIQEHIRDIAGIRIICSFVSDIYRISEMIQAQSDLQIVEVKDYIQHPKPNGYQSLHIIMKIPVYMSDGKIYVYVEMQIRTIAMHFWASLEHKIYYKYNKQVPNHLTKQLKEAANTVAELDRRMEHINKEINILQENDTCSDNRSLLYSPRELLVQLMNNSDNQT
jgi:putative GTP pyrophosphokinase